MTDVEVAILASIATENVVKGATLSSTEVEVIGSYVARTDALTANQKRVWRAVLESHERLRVEKLLVRLV